MAAGVSVDDVAARLGQLARLHRPDHGASPTWLAHELTFSQLRLLFLLREHGSLTMSGLAEALGVTAATASGAVERIERHGLVERRHRPDDRRVVECVLAEAGERLVRELAGARLDAMRAMLGVLTPDELAEFDRLVGLVIERLAAGPASGADPASGASS
jgi:DNA-binding MarR family transcriptional regulator